MHYFPSTRYIPSKSACLISTFASTVLGKTQRQVLTNNPNFIFLSLHRGKGACRSAAKTDGTIRRVVYPGLGTKVYEETERTENWLTRPRAGFFWDFGEHDTMFQLPLLLLHYLGFRGRQISTSAPGGRHSSSPSSLLCHSTRASHYFRHRRRNGEIAEQQR